MLNGLAGFIARYDGKFKFESGGKYPEGLFFTFDIRYSL
jgi:hypothetical protein